MTLWFAAHAQSTELHQPGLKSFLKKKTKKPLNIEPPVQAALNPTLILTDPILTYQTDNSHRLFIATTAYLYRVHPTSQINPNSIEPNI